MKITRKTMMRKRNSLTSGKGTWLMRIYVRTRNPSSQPTRTTKTVQRRRQRIRRRRNRIRTKSRMLMRVSLRKTMTKMAMKMKRKTITSYHLTFRKSSAKTKRATMKK